jgi:hypothetical protein
MTLQQLPKRYSPYVMVIEMQSPELSNGRRFSIDN